MTRVATWNVNGIRARLPQLLRWLATTRPDLVALQETKVRNEDFPVAELKTAGYQCLFHGEPRYNGVATLWRDALPPQVQHANTLPGLADDACRLLASASDTLRLINVYVPNGQSLGSEAYRYKLAWLDALKALLLGELDAADRSQVPLVLLGDFNIAPDDTDVHDPTLWSDSVLVSAPERGALRSLFSTGMHDVYRERHPEGRDFSWWDYRMQAFRRNRGLRIDLILGCRRALERGLDCWVDRHPRELEKPSDHAPVLLELA